VGHVGQGQLVLRRKAAAGGPQGVARLARHRRADGNTWSQAEQDIGMDWLELGFDKPVQATAVRAVFTGTDAIQAITKVELIDEAGAAQAVWSGLSEEKADKRGERTWMVKTFPKTATKIKAVKLTFANNVSSGYKEVDAIQLVGE
jgi:hypothetical protein